MLEASGAAGSRGVRGHDEAGEPDGIEFNEKKKFKGISKGGSKEKVAEISRFEKGCNPSRH